MNQPIKSELLRAFHGDPAIKAKYLARVQAHVAADELIQGIGWGDAKGCAIGCTLNAYDHSRYPIELGLPTWLAHLEDAIFEGLSSAEAQTWPARFLDAIPVGADVEPVRWKLAIWRHERQLRTLETNTEPYAEECRVAIACVIAYCRLRLDMARLAAESASWSARAASWSAAESAAWSAAESAAAARSASWKMEGEQLLVLLSEAACYTT